MTPAQRQIALRKIALSAIPDDWEVVTVGSIAQKKPNSIVGGPFGSDLVSADYVPAGVPVIRGQNMGQAFVSGDFVFVSEEKAKALSSNLAAPGDVIFTQRGTLGQVSVVPYGPFDRYLVSQSQMKLSVDTQRFDIAFLCHYFSSAAGQQQIVESAIQTGVPHTNLTILRGYFLPRPPLPEQQSIAAALSGADGVVAGLERVIAKKRLIKQGAMQDLLTARRRLPGSSGEWQHLKISDLERRGSIKLGRGRVISKVDIAEIPGQFPIYSSSALNNGLFGSFGHYDFDEELITWSIDGGGHFFHRPKHKFSVTNVCGFLRITDNSLDYRFVAEALKSARMGMKFDYQDKAHPSVIRGAYTIPIPSTDEQKSIAMIAADMDAEIRTLRARLTKARAVKEGMMQNLLTGRVRLV